jgi:hypothetical protein
MPKALVISGFVVSALILLLFGLDLAVGIPFEKVNPTIDITFLVSSLLLAYLSWNALRDVR